MIAVTTWCAKNHKLIHITNIVIAGCFLVVSIFTIIRGIYLDSTDQGNPGKPVISRIWLGNNPEIINGYYHNAFVNPKNPDYDKIAKKSIKTWIIPLFYQDNKYTLDIYYEIKNSHVCIHRQMEIDKPVDKRNNEYCITYKFKEIKIQENKLMIVWQPDYCSSKGVGQVLLGILGLIIGLPWLVVSLSDYPSKNETDKSKVIAINKDNPQTIPEDEFQILLDKTSQT